MKLSLKHLIALLSVLLNVRTLTQSGRILSSHALLKQRNLVMNGASPMMGIFVPSVREAGCSPCHTHPMHDSSVALAVKTLPLVSSMSSRRLLKWLITSEAVLRTPKFLKCCVGKLGSNSVYSCSTRRFAGYHGERLSMRVRTERRNRLVSGKGENR